MIPLRWALLLLAVLPCEAQTLCPAALEDAASRVQTIRKELRQIPIRAMDDVVPATAGAQLTQLKDALSCLADAALAQAGPPVDPEELQENMTAAIGGASSGIPEPAGILHLGTGVDEEPRVALASDLTAGVSRPKAGFLEIEFAIGIPCSQDHVLLVYALDGGAWKRRLRWQAPPWTGISGAFGDFFVSAMLSPSAGAASMPPIVVAHGTPWCTSRLSGFAIDVLSEGSVPDSPKVLWHTERSYSRGDIPSLSSSGDTFELRVTGLSFDIDLLLRPAIYRYRLDERQIIHRLQPVAADVRGFVEEWLSAPWPESAGFTAPGAALEAVHQQLRTVSGSRFVSHGFGPVTTCTAPGTFQVEIHSEAGDPSQPLPTRYFHIREIKGGYLMVSAPTAPDPGCTRALPR